MKLQAMDRFIYVLAMPLMIHVALYTYKIAHEPTVTSSIKEKYRVVISMYRYLYTSTSSSDINGTDTPYFQGPAFSR